MLLAVGCAQGMFQTVKEAERVFNEEGIEERYPVCRPCPVSMYEDGVGSTARKQCPELYRTKRSESTSAQDCYGEYYCI